jgi:hypothetical protein
MSCASSVLTVEKAGSVLDVEPVFCLLECEVVIPDITFTFLVGPDDNFLVGPDDNFLGN